MYDESGRPIAFALSENNGAYEYYFYENNIFGDITAIYDDEGNVVASYKYDAWGNLTTTSSKNNFFTDASLFKYRGYIYDWDTGFYYLQSRYYDPEVGRFLNSDSVEYLGANGDLISYNLYAYCSNNPVMNTDYTGHFVISATVATLLGIGVALVIFDLWMCTPEGQKIVQESASALAQAIDNAFDAPSDKIAERIQKLDDKHKGEYTVYALKDDSGNIQYVGRTKNLERRLAEHSRKGSKTEGLRLAYSIQGLTWSEARGLEQLGIASYNTINLGKNSINGISPKNINREAYLTAAWNYIYNQATNEWYNLLGK